MLSRSISPSKTLIVVLCCAVPLAFLVAIWIVFGRQDDEDVVQRIALALGIALVTVFVAIRAFDSCAVLLDDKGIEYVRLMADKWLFVRQRLQWKDVVQVSMEGDAFVLRGAGLEIPVRPMVFREPRDVVAYMKARLPPHLVYNAGERPK